MQRILERLLLLASLLLYEFTLLANRRPYACQVLNFPMKISTYYRLTFECGAKNDH